MRTSVPIVHLNYKFFLVSNNKELNLHALKLTLHQSDASWDLTHYIDMSEIKKRVRQHA